MSLQIDSSPHRHPTNGRSQHGPPSPKQVLLSLFTKQENLSHLHRQILAFHPIFPEWGDAVMVHYALFTAGMVIPYAPFPYVLGDTLQMAGWKPIPSQEEPFPGDVYFTSEPSYGPPTGCGFVVSAASWKRDESVIVADAEAVARGRLTKRQVFSPENEIRVWMRCPT